MTTMAMTNTTPAIKNTGFMFSFFNLTLGAALVALHMPREITARASHSAGASLR